MLSADPDADGRLTAAERELLAGVARRAVAAAARRRDEPTPEVPDGGRLSLAGASFVTLHRGRELRGCIGSIEPRRPLVHDVAANGRAAALADVRFAPVAVGELGALAIELSVLGPRRPLVVASELELLAALRPGVDGLILELGARRATFLPTVWEQLPDPREFVAQLRRKAGISASWSPSLRVARYEVEAFAAGSPLDD